MWVRVWARVGASAGQAAERRCSRSPLGEVQEGRRQAPDSPVATVLVRVTSFSKNNSTT